LVLLRIAQSAGRGARDRSADIRAFADLLPCPASGTDILVGAASVATHHQSARDKQQKDRGSQHDFSLGSDFILEREETQESISEQAAHSEGQDQIGKLQGKNGFEPFFPCK
jgi:hypothetical protein